MSFYEMRDPWILFFITFSVNIYDTATQLNIKIFFTSFYKLLLTKRLWVVARIRIYYINSFYNFGGQINNVLVYIL